MENVPFFSKWCKGSFKTLEGPVPTTYTLSTEKFLVLRLNLLKFHLCILECSGENGFQSAASYVQLHTTVFLLAFLYM